MIERTEADLKADMASEAAAAADFDAEVLAALSVPVRSRLAPNTGPARYFPDDTFEALDAFRSLLLNNSRFETVLQGLSEQVVAAIPGADMAGVTLLQNDSGIPQTVACSDARVVDVDTDQYRANEGPCLEAARTGRIVRVSVDDIGELWPSFAANAAKLGIGSYLSAPLVVDSEHAGSLNIYSFDNHGFNDIDEVVVKMFVTSAEVTVFNSRHTQAAKDEVVGLRQAMKTRGTIEQAKGIVMAVRGISPDAAFAALSDQSQRENTKLSVLAARIVNSAVEGERQIR